MRCHHARKMVSEYVDGGLDERRAADLERHLAVCPDCRDLLKDFRGIVREARSLETVAPPEAAWTKVRAAVEAARAERPAARRPLGAEIKPARPFVLVRRPVWSAAAAALLVAVVGGLVLIRPWSPRPTSDLSERDRYTLAKLDEAKGFYRQAIKSLAEAASAQKGALDSKSAAAFAQNLATVDRSIEACQAAVRRDPRNLDNQNFLLAAYKDKVDILTALIDVKKESGSSPAGSARVTL